MSFKGNPADKNRSKFKITKPSAQPQEDEKLWEELRKYARLVPFEPDPNLGRVKEIMDEIKKGNYPTREMINQTAAHLANRLTQRSENFSQ